MTEKVKPVIIHDNENGIDYTLEYNRESIKFAESKGFDIADVTKQPMNKLPELFFYAFRWHHKNMARANTDALLEKMGGFPDGLIERLGQLYAVPYETLIQGETDQKNSQVVVEL